MGKNYNGRHFEILVLIFQENRLWYFMPKETTGMKYQGLVSKNNK